MIKAAPASPGEYTDAETGFVYLRARYYDSATGQFISRDPLVAMTRAPYSYADGNPLNDTDPLGLFSLKSVARTVKSIAGVVAVASSAAAALAYTTAVVCGPVALCSGTALSAGVFFGGVSAASEGVATTIECLDGGGFDKACMAGIASSAINALVPRVGNNVGSVFSRKLGEEAGERLKGVALAAGATLGFSTNTATLLWNRQASNNGCGI